MKKILILSGKGGTGKTTFTSAFSFLLKKNDVIVDCDVDAADMHIILEPDYNKRNTFLSGKSCQIQNDKCKKCNLCVEKCHYGAINLVDNYLKIDKIKCENCLLCYHICPHDAIKLDDCDCGEHFVSKTRVGNTMVHANLKPGADNSGRLVSTIKAIAEDIAKDNNSEIVLCDGPPGIACPVIASITGMDYIVLVTEPTLSGVSDLKRLVELISHFKISTGLIINKSTINKEIKQELLDFASRENISILGEIPYSEIFYKVLIDKKSLVEVEDSAPIKDSIINIWNKILQTA